MRAPALGAEEKEMNTCLRRVDGNRCCGWSTLDCEVCVADNHGGSCPWRSDGNPACCEDWAEAPCQEGELDE